MQHDEVIWQVIRHNHCSFMTKITTGNFCRNPYNLTGVCNRSSCPLANSRYATIRDHDGSNSDFVQAHCEVNELVHNKALVHNTLERGVFYLYMKTIERAHMPNKLWERVKLPQNYVKALEIIDKHMMYWPKFLLHKIKQRLTKMTQMRIRMRKLALKTREKIMTRPRKEIKRESRREEKAEKAAVLEKSIENEILERLQKGVYEGIYNYPAKNYEKMLDDLSKTVQAESEEENEEDEIEYVEGYEELEVEDDMEDFPGLPHTDMDDEDAVGSDEDDEEEEVVVAVEPTKKGRSASDRKLAREERASSLKKKKARVLVEVEGDDADERQVQVQ